MDALVRATGLCRSVLLVALAGCAGGGALRVEDITPEWIPALEQARALHPGDAATLGRLGVAYFKAQEGALQVLPTEGTVLITVVDSDKEEALQVAKHFVGLGFNVLATQGTHKLLSDHGVPSECSRNRTRPVPASICR